MLQEEIDLEKRILDRVMNTGQRRRRSRSKSQSWQGWQDWEETPSWEERPRREEEEEEDVEMGEVGWGSVQQKGQGKEKDWRTDREPKGEGKREDKGKGSWKGKEEEKGKGGWKGNDEKGKGKEKKGKQAKGKEEADRSREDSPPLYAGGRPFKKTMCKHFERGSCKNGATCTWAHGEEELEDRQRRKHGSWY
jgi:hypothetical protein